MAKGNDALKTITVAAVLCIVCSIIVSSTVVTLKPKQIKNKELDVKKNILMSAGIIEAGATNEAVEEKFKSVETILFDFETGKISTAHDVKTYNQNKAASDSAMNVMIPAALDSAGLVSRAKVAKAFVIKNSEGKFETIILNVRGKGLWSTMYGFIALAADTVTVKGFAYYAQGETPGLGGEVDNPNWKKQWVGKKVYDENFKPAFAVAKGTVDNTHGLAQYRVDGLSGATITADGVTSSMKYWFSDHAYGKFLANVRAGEI